MRGFRHKRIFWPAFALTGAIHLLLEIRAGALLSMQKQDGAQESVTYCPKNKSRHHGH